MAWDKDGGAGKTEVGRAEGRNPDFRLCGGWQPSTTPFSTTPLLPRGARGSRPLSISTCVLLPLGSTWFHLIPLRGGGSAIVPIAVGRVRAPLLVLLVPVDCFPDRPQREGRPECVWRDAKHGARERTRSPEIVVARSEPLKTSRKPGKSIEVPVHEPFTLQNEFSPVKPDQANQGKSRNRPSAIS